MTVKVLVESPCLITSKRGYIPPSGSGLCSRGAQVPQAINFYLWATGKIYFFLINFSAGHPGYHGLEALGS